METEVSGAHALVNYNGMTWAYISGKGWGWTVGGAGVTDNRTERERALDEAVRLVVRACSWPGMWCPYYLSGYQHKDGRIEWHFDTMAVNEKTVACARAEFSRLMTERGYR